MIPRRDDPIPEPPVDERRRARAGTLAGLAVIVVALVVAVAFAWPETADARHVVDDVVAEQALIDMPRRATLVQRAVPASPFSRRASGVGWRPVAIWDLTVDSRDAISVVWEKAGHRVVHTQLDGAPLERPSGSGRTGRGGVLLYGIESDLRNAVVWTENGRTAIVSGADLSLGDLYDLAGGPAPA